MGITKYVAHRGLSAEAPENTLPAFELACQSGFWGIECDTYCTTDGRWIVHHDLTVDRMTNGSGRTKDFSFEAIRNLKLVSGHQLDKYPSLQIPALEELLAVCLKYGVYAFVEIEEYHHDHDLQTLVDMVERSGMASLCRFICFDADTLRKVRKLNGSIPLGYLSAKPCLSDDIALVRSLAPAFLDYEYRQIAPEDIRLCQSAGVEVSLWTINSSEEAQPYVRAGVDYITTDTRLV